jgi:D-alanyl-lipoteichoic acid acyltransferase DltB (MBOAT superfamily)
MMFKILQFLIFFAAIYIPYLFLSHKWQNRLLLAVSCIFYAALDWRCIFLIFTSITTDYFCGLKIYESDNEKIKKRFLFVSVLVNLSILGFFKYFNFFIANFAQLINHFGFSIHPHILHILLPVGISFYTFKTISYTIDVYTERIQPARSYRDYALFVSFFPLILAGPIMRAGDLLRQISSPRRPRLGWFYEGCYLVFWGAFQKFFVADNLAVIADRVFNSSPPYNGAAVLLAVYAFAFQIYCDFAGYSNIARGLGKCMGFDIMINFNLPYFATNPQDFWKRWHISLSKWLRDYLYNPIAFSLRLWGAWSVVVALMSTFLICGLWHGAAWTFVAWGGYWGLLLTIYMLLQPYLAKIPTPGTEASKRLLLYIRIILFFHLICLGWLIFRAQSITQALNMARDIFCNFLIPHNFLHTVFYVIFCIFLLLIVEIFQFIKNDLLIVMKSSVYCKTIFVLAIVYLSLYVMILGNEACIGGGREFIYFQF